MRNTLVALSVVLAAASLSMAQNKIGTVNAGKILTEIKETKAANEAFRAEQQALQAQAAEKSKAVQEMEAQRNQLKPDAPQWTDLNKRVVEARAQVKAWAETSDQELVRKFRDQAKRMSAKIKEAIAEVAKEKGLDLVIAEQNEPTEAEMERIPPQQLMQVLLNKSVYFRSANVDITQDVITKLDSAFDKK